MSNLRFKEEDRYSYRGLLNRVFRTDSNNVASDWRYRYSASGEREQKRMIYTSAWDSVLPYPWVYYLLGGENQQLAVYHGQQTSGTGMCGDTGRRVYMYPTEYLMHGIGYTGVPEDISQVITDANGGKQFRISDHLASLRVTLDATGTSHDDFDPWGNPLPKGTVLASRRGYNDREKDRETGRLNLGVRSMGDGDHFTSIDPLWEKFPSQSPYAYANDNPLRMTDPTGMQAIPRVQYIPGTVDWLRENGGGGGGVAPLVVVGGLITYAAQHPEQSVPFMMQMANDINQALTHPIGFAVNTIGVAITVASEKSKDWKYHPAPKDPPYDGLQQAKSKTPKQGGGLRKRWKDADGIIYEWDYENGAVEKYTKRGKHLGEFDAETGEQRKPADPSRKVEP